MDYLNTCRVLILGVHSRIVPGTRVACVSDKTSGADDDSSSGVAVFLFTVVYYGVNIDRLA